MKRPLFECAYCDATFRHDIGRKVHQRTCNDKYLPVDAEPDGESDGEEPPPKVPRLEHTPCATAGRSQPAAPASPPASAQISLAISRDSPHAQPCNPCPLQSAVETALVVADAGASAAAAATAAGGSGAATRAIRLPSQRPFKVADVRLLACEVDDEVSDPSAALADAGKQEQAHCLHILVKLPRVDQAKLIQLLDGGQPGSHIPQVKTPADVPRLLEDWAASGGRGGVRVSGCHLSATCTLRVCNRVPSDLCSWLLRNRSSDEAEQ